MPLTPAKPTAASIGAVPTDLYGVSVGQTAALYCTSSPTIPVGGTVSGSLLFCDTAATYNCGGGTWRNIGVAVASGMGLFQRIA